MKLNNTFLIAAVIFLSLFSTAFAGDRTVNGLIIGGGSGALIGQAIGHNAESTIIGATVGGILGIIIGNNGHSSVHGGYHYVPTYSDTRYRNHQNPRIIKERYRSSHRYNRTWREPVAQPPSHRKKGNGRSNRGHDKTQNRSYR